jgi:hypothetical protein
VGLSETGKIQHEMHQHLRPMIWGSEECYFHCWTTESGQPKAIVEDSTGGIMLLDPWNVRFTDR